MQTEVSQGIRSVTWEAKIFRADGSVEDLGVIAKTRYDQSRVSAAFEKMATKVGFKWRT